MGTRGLLGLISKGVRHGAYNHFDSYPSGLGALIVEFILSLTPEQWDEMAKRVEEITWVDQKDPPSKELQDYYTGLGYLNLEVNVQRPDDWYCLLHRVQGAKALLAILKGDLKHLADQVEFLSDGLFCEWAYFVDFEKRTIETYKSGELVEETTFDKLDEGYMNRLEEKARREDGEEGEDETSRDS